VWIGNWITLISITLTIITNNLMVHKFQRSLSVPYFFIIPFYLQSVLVHSANRVKNVYSGM
jgi:hypothetical protein